MSVQIVEDEGAIIRVSNEAYKELFDLKYEWRLRSFAEVIDRILKERKPTK